MKLVIGSREAVKRRSIMIADNAFEALLE